MDDMFDAKQRMMKSTKSMGALKHMHCSREVPLTSKIKLYTAILVNSYFFGATRMGVEIKKLWLKFSIANLFIGPLKFRCQE